MADLIDAKNMGNKNTKLPFSIDKMSFIGWVNDLDLENKVESLKYLSTTLKILKQESIKAEDKYFFLQELSEIVQQLSQQLQETYKNSSFPFTEQNNKKLELSVNCSTEIAVNYAQLCEDKDFMFSEVFTQQQKALVIYNGIRALVNVLFYRSLLYKKPGKGFWKLCFLFYLFAKQNKVLDVKLESKNVYFFSRFKQILLFGLINVRQFNTEELFAVFYLLNKFSDQVELISKVPDKKFRGIPSINLRVDAPPSLLKDVAQQEQPYIFYISSLNVIKQLVKLSEYKNTLKSFNKSTLLRLIKTLTMNYQRNSEREITDDRVFASIGLNKVKAYILETEKTRREKENNAQDRVFDIQDIETDRGMFDYFREERAERAAYLDLSLLTDSVIMEDIKSVDIWPEKEENTEQESKKPAVNTELIDKSSTGFRLSLNAVTTKVGDIVGVTILENFVITIVRRIIHSQGNQLQVGVEVLGINPETLKLAGIWNKKTVTALYLKGDNDVESIIIGSNDFKNEDYIFTDKLTRFKVEKQLYMSSTIKHLRVKNENI